MLPPGDDLGLLLKAGGKDIPPSSTGATMRYDPSYRPLKSSISLSSSTGRDQTAS